MTFADPYDQLLAEQGPAGLFTFTHDGELQFDLFRTRDWRRRFAKSDCMLTVWNHCVCTDVATGWPIYVLITGNELVCSDERTVTVSFETLEAALEYVAVAKNNLYRSKMVGVTKEVE